MPVSAAGMQALSADPALAVTFLAVTRATQQCQELPRLLSDDLAHSIAFRCLEPSHFEPEVWFCLIRHHVGGAARNAVPDAPHWELGSLEVPAGMRAHSYHPDTSRDI